MFFAQPGLEPGPQILTNIMLQGRGRGNATMDHVGSHPEELKIIMSHCLMLIVLIACMRFDL